MSRAPWNKLLADGSQVSEWWLSYSGQVTQHSPEYSFGKDYFRELLERVRSIRASERRIWQQITDIFAECSIDYDKNSEITYRFYPIIQNKFHYAITGKTAAEIIYHQADHTKENMGLTTWKNAPDSRILKSDTPIAKNYLDEKQIRQLERAVTGYFDYAGNCWFVGHSIFLSEKGNKNPQPKEQRSVSIFERTSVVSSCILRELFADVTKVWKLFNDGVKGRITGQELLEAAIL